MLRDRIVCGISHEGIQKKLLAEKDLDYDTAYSLAIAIEAAEKDTKHLSQNSGNVFFTGNKPSGGYKPPRSSNRDKAGKGISCYRCGGDHLAPACRHLNTECSYCKKMGHLGRVCRAKKKALEQEKPPKQDKKKSKNLYVQEEPESDEVYELYHIRDSSTKPTQLQFFVNDLPVEMIMDTGASLSIISKATSDRINEFDPTVTLTPSSSRLKTYTALF